MQHEGQQRLGPFSRVSLKGTALPALVLSTLLAAACLPNPSFGFAVVPAPPAAVPHPPISSLQTQKIALSRCDASVPTTVVRMSSSTEVDESPASATANSTESSSSSSLSSYEPHPPEYPPPPMTGDLQRDYETLREEGMSVEQTLQTLQVNVDDIKSALEEKQAELAKAQDNWSLEKTGLVAKIAEFTNLLSAKDEEDEEEKHERERLEREVELLQDQLLQATNALKTQQKNAQELQLRIADVEDALEFQQMEFNKQKEGLEATVQAEKKKLRDIENQWEKDKSIFARERQTIQLELVEEKKRLESAQKEWERNQDDFETERTKLEEKMSQQAERLRATTLELDSERAERSKLERAIEAERDKLVQVQKTLKDEQERFEKVQSELQDKISDEQRKVSDLTDRLEKEQQRFESEKNRLESQIKAERERLQQVEDRLETEQMVFAMREDALESQLAEEIRLRKVKKKHMNNRYAAIRRELTELWQGAKREAKKEKQQLTEKYESELEQMTASVSSLERQLRDVETQNGELQSLLKDVTAQREQAAAENQRLEKQYMSVVSARNREIADLQESLQELRVTITEKEETIEQYRTSYRQLLKLSVQVTGTKLNRVKGWFRRRRSGRSKM